MARSWWSSIPIAPARRQCADWYLPINPGTDVALALGMMHVIINDGLHDADYVARIRWVSTSCGEGAGVYAGARCGVDGHFASATSSKLAREYATTRPAVIRVNYGIQRSENGGMATRAVTMLPCITGSWKEVGGGLAAFDQRRFRAEQRRAGAHDLMEESLGRPARTINMVELGKALTESNDPPVKALFVYNSNPAAVCPDHNEVVRGLHA